MGFNHTEDNDPHNIRANSYWRVRYSSSYSTNRDPVEMFSQYMPLKRTIGLIKVLLQQPHISIKCVERIRRHVELSGSR